MHSLEVIHTRDIHAVIREFDEAVADGDHTLARQIAKANPDVYTHDGRRHWRCKLRVHLACQHELFRSPVVG